MFPAASNRNTYFSALHDLKERLLHALAGHIPSDRHAFGFTGNLIHLIDVHDPLLGPFDIIVGLS